MGLCPYVDVRTFCFFVTTRKSRHFLKKINKLNYFFSLSIPRSPFCLAPTPPALRMSCPALSPSRSAWRRYPSPGSRGGTPQSSTTRGGWGTWKIWRPSSRTGRNTQTGCWQRTLCRQVKITDKVFFCKNVTSNGLSRNYLFLTQSLNSTFEYFVEPSIGLYRTRARLDSIPTCS